MTHCDGQSNGERSWSSHASQRVTRGEHRQHQHEGGEHLDAEYLSERHSRARLWSTHYIDGGVLRDKRQSFENCRSSDCTHRLHHDVQERPVTSTTIKSQTERGVKYWRFYSSCYRRLIEQGLTCHQTHYRSYRGRFLQVIWPNQQCQCTEGNQLVLQIRLESHQDHSTITMLQ